MKIPDKISLGVRDRLWGLADRIGWATLSDSQKSAFYEQWIQDDDVGQILARYMRPQNIRVYVKDTILKPYGRERIKEVSPILSLLGLPQDMGIVREYIKPHGRLLCDDRIICWGHARDWKAVIVSVFERAWRIPKGKAYAAILMYSSGKMMQPNERRLVSDASQYLGIERLIWRDD
jgi:hypothetical protein